MGVSKKTELVRTTLRRYPGLPSRTIARYLLAHYGDTWDNDLEKIRAAIRYQRGSHGVDKRKDKLDKSLFTGGPIKMPQTWREKRQDYKLPVGVTLVLSDMHVPYHEPVPIEAAVKAGQAEKVDTIFINGDLQDCASLGYWRIAKRDFNKEVEAVIDFLDWLRQEFPKAKIVYKPGNHEYRLPSYYMANAPELAESPLAAMETLLGFEERDIEFLGYFQKVLAGKLPILHGHEIKHLQRTVNPARGLFLKTKTYAACSHCHSTSVHPGKNLHGELLTTWSFGCLCDLEPDWNPYGNDWNWGYAIINVEKNGDFEVENRRILPNGKVV